MNELNIHKDAKGGIKIELKTESDALASEIAKLILGPKPEEILFLRPSDKPVSHEPVIALLSDKKEAEVAAEIAPPASRPAMKPPVPMPIPKGVSDAAKAKMEAARHDHSVPMSRPRTLPLIPGSETKELVYSTDPDKFQSKDGVWGDPAFRQESDGRMVFRTKICCPTCFKESMRYCWHTATFVKCRNCEEKLLLEPIGSMTVYDGRVGGNVPKPDEEGVYFIGCRLFMPPTREESAG